MRVDVASVKPQEVNQTQRSRRWMSIRVDINLGNVWEVSELTAVDGYTDRGDPRTPVGSS
jgi:hypothetical protein